MGDGVASIETSVAVAGMSVLHRFDRGIGFADTHGVQLSPPEQQPDYITVHHAIGPADVNGMRPTLHVNERVTYFEGVRGLPAVCLTPLDATAPRQLLRTVREGHEYRVEYAFPPLRPVDRRDSELPAYTLALAARERGMMAHGCGFVLPSDSVALCLGMSGAGKSTLGRLMRDIAGLTVLNDDRIVVTRESDGFHAWGTPWPGRAGIARSGDGKLGVIGLIRRAEPTQSRMVTPREALARLLETFALPLWDAARMAFGLGMIDEMLNAVPIVEIGYPLADGTAEWIVDTLAESE